MNTKQRQGLITGSLGLLAFLLTSTTSIAADPAGELAAALAQADTALGAGQFDEAATALAPHTGATGAAATALAKLAEVRGRQQRAAEAIDLMDRAVALEPDDARWHSQLAIALSQRVGEVSGMEQGQLAQRMLMSFEQAVKLDPELVDGYIGLARYYTYAPDFAGGSRVRAEQYAAEVSKRVAWLGAAELANIALHFADLDQAEAHLRRADELSPHNPMVQEMLARLAVARKDVAAQ